MITVNRLRHRLVHAKARHDSRRAIAHANRIKARTLRQPVPGDDELSNPYFLGVMAVAVVVLVIDVSDHWSEVTWAVAVLVDVVRTFGLGV